MADELPRTSLPGLGVVEVFKDGHKLRARVLLELPEVGGTMEDWDRARRVATEWQKAIRSRAGISVDFYLATLDGLRDAPALEMDYGYGSQARIINEAIAEAGRAAVEAGESWEAPGCHIAALLEWLGPFYPNDGEAETAARMVVERISKGAPVPWRAQKAVQPINKNRVLNSFNRARRDMPVREVEPWDRSAAETAWREQPTPSAMDVFMARQGWSAGRVPVARSAPIDNDAEE